MSEQVRKQATDQSTAGRTDLSDLSASKDLHKKADMQPSNATDLASVSISSSSFVRASSQAVPAAQRGRHSTTLDRAITTETKLQATTTKSSTTTTPGLFKNPFYPYRGGLASKIITFFANLLKILERLFLRLLGARDVVAPTPRHQQTQALKTDQKEPREEKREDTKRTAQAIHRS